MKRINLLALVIFIACLGWVFTLPAEKREAIHSTVLGWFTPVFEAQTAIEGDPQIESDLQLEPSVLAADNAELRRQLAELTIYRERSELLQEEVNRLNGLLDFKISHKESLIPARVISRTASNWWSSLVIDKGSLDGVGTDLPVRNEIGIIGKTAEVSPNSAKIILLTDEQCRVAARIDNTNEQGILMGSRGGLGGGNELRMRFLSKDAVIPPGLKVYSSGAGGLFPANVFMGTVQEFTSGDVYGECVVAPSVDFGQVRNVFVVVQDDDILESPAPVVPANSNPNGSVKPTVPGSVPLDPDEAGVGGYEAPARDSEIPRALPLNPTRIPGGGL